jgi:hypothetical protein
MQFHGYNTVMTERAGNYDHNKMPEIKKKTRRSDRRRGTRAGAEVQDMSIKASGSSVDVVSLLDFVREAQKSKQKRLTDKDK